MNDKAISQDIELRQILPRNWYSDSRNDNVWIACYRVLRVVSNDFHQDIFKHILDIRNVRVAILFGKFSYVDSSGVKQLFETPDPHNVEIRVEGTASQNRTPAGAYTFFFARYDSADRQGESTARNNIETAVGLLASFNGRNIVYEHFYDNSINLNSGDISIFGETQECPLWFPIPDISEKRLEFISKTSKTISSQKPQDRNRIYLSLRWFSKGSFSSGTDAFLNYWIALETLGMPDGTKIRPLVESLARAYKLSYEDTQKTFMVGRLIRVRGKIVHEGALIPIHGNLLSYLEGLYVDILFEHLGIPNELRAELILNKPDFDLKSSLGQS